MDITTEFKKWLSKKRLINLVILNNGVEIASLKNLKVKGSNELNESGYPEDLTAYNTSCSVDIGTHYINDIIKTNEGCWLVIVDGYNNYLFF